MSSLNLFGLPNSSINELRANRDVPELIKCLKYRNCFFTSGGAAIALGRLGDPRAVEPLIAALKDESNEFLRQTAAWALGQLGDARAVEPLVAALSDKEVDVRLACVEALERLGDIRAVKALVAVLGDQREDWKLTGAAARALKLRFAYDPRAVDALKAWRRRVEGQFRDRAAADVHRGSRQVQ